jgi:hypothetical protein
LLCKELAFDDSFVGAFAGASAAIDTGVGIDDVLAFAFSDSAQGASVGASAAAHASISDNICHVGCTSIKICKFILSYFSENANGNSANPTKCCRIFFLEGGNHPFTRK